jgi:hypothetical protein
VEGGRVNPCISVAAVAEKFDALADISEVMLQAEGLVYSML